VVLAGIVSGTWAGGRFADLIDPGRTLEPVLVAGGLFALTTLPLVRGLGELAVARGNASALVLVALFGFFPLAAVLSAISPTVVKVQLASLGETGAVVGRLSAIGTAGALVTGFGLIARFGVTSIVLALGIGLVAGEVILSVALGIGRRRARGALGVVAATLALASAAFS